MKHIKLFEDFNQDKLDTGYYSPSVGDTVYINYKIPGGSNNYEPTPVKIIAIKGSGREKVYIASHNVELSKFKFAPDQSVKRTDIIGPYKGVETPAGYGWVAKNPNINTGVNQVSNDMAI